MAAHATLYLTHRSARHQQALLEAAPKEFEITVRRSPSKEEIMALLPGKEFLITERTGIIDADIIRAGKDLRLIQRLGSQTYDIDLEAARVAGIPVCYWPVYSCIMVAEHMLMQMLGVAKRLREVMDIATEAGDWGRESQKCDENYFAYNWSGRKDIRGLYQSTVGILGMGEIGTELARRLRGFGCMVLYNKRTRLPESAERELNVRYVSLDELLAESDFVCMLLPFFPEVEQMIDANLLSRMKRGACLVSCGAGGVINEAALADALRSGHLYGAATDTYTYEPLRRDNPLLPLAREPRTNIILTPHTAAGTIAAHRDERHGDYGNLMRILKGEPLLFRLV